MTMTVGSSARSPRRIRLWKEQTGEFVSSVYSCDEPLQELQGLDLCPGHILEPGVFERVVIVIRKVAIDYVIYVQSLLKPLECETHQASRMGTNTQENMWVAV